VWHYLVSSGDDPWHRPADRAKMCWAGEPINLAATGSSGGERPQCLALYFPVTVNMAIMTPIPTTKPKPAE
jgi:hypothetical protein